MKILLILVNQASNFGFIDRLNLKFFPGNSLTIPCLASITPEKHEIQCIDCRYQKIDYDTDADIIGISTLTPSAEKAYSISDEFRKLGKTVVIGGYHASLFPEQTKKHADSVVIAEAEYSWPQLLNDFEKGELKPFYKTEKCVDPKDIPMPRHDIEKIKPLFVGVSTSRGCPYNCSYCNISHVFGNTYRPRPIENVVREIKKIPRKYLVFIYDSSLTIDKNYVKALFKEMIPLKKKFIAYGSAPVLMKDEEILKLASEAGCLRWNIGFESINQESLNDDAKKSYKVDDYYKLVKRIHNHRMSVYCSLIFGFDHDKPEIFDLTLDALYDYGVDSASFFILTPFPNTTLYKKLDCDGRILTNDWSKYDLHHVVFQPKHMSPNELRDGVAKISHRFYSSDKILERMVRVTLITRSFSNILVDGYNNILLAQHFKTIYSKKENNI